MVIEFGLTRNEYRYILDPKDILGPDFPSETLRFPIEQEEKQNIPEVADEERRDIGS